jgi:hypothetical protein
MPMYSVGDPRDINNTTSTGGSMDEGYYYYRFRFRYGKLGVSNLGVNAYGPILVGSGESKVRLTNLHVMRPGNDDGVGPTTLIPALHYMPTELEIWRTLVQPTVVSDVAFKLPYYFVDSVAFSETASVTFDDTKNDSELITLYEGNNYSEPYFDLLLTAQYSGVLYNQAYQETPKARYVYEHRNRMWYANIEQFNQDPYDPLITGYPTTGEYVKYPSRVYWSDLYQPDRWTGFVDVFPEDGDEITGIISLHNNLVVMKRTHTYLIIGSSPDNFEVRLASPNNGCVAPRTIQVMENAVISRSVDVVHAFDGANFTSISEKIRPDIEAVSKNNREFCAAGVWRGRYYLAQEETVL